MRADADGRHRFDALAPGDWYVSRLAKLGGGLGYAESSVDADWEFPSNACVLPGTTTKFDLVDPDPTVLVIRGRIAHAERLQPGLTIRALRDEATDPFRSYGAVTGELHEDGTFEVTPPDAGAAILTVSSPALAGTLR